MSALLRVVVSTLLAASGALWLAAAAERWWPVCTLGRFDDRACIRVQDHAFDYVTPSAPWTPIGDSAQLAGASLVCLSVAVAVLPWLWVPRPRTAAVAVSAAAVSLSVLGVNTWSAGMSDAPVPSGFVATSWILWVFAVPTTLVTAAVVRSADVPRALTRWRLVTAVLVGLSTPLAIFLFGPLFVGGYRSHDSTPWVEGASAAFLVLAAVAVWPSTRLPAHPDDGRRLPAGVVGETLLPWRTPGRDS